MDTKLFYVCFNAEYESTLYASDKSNPEQLIAARQAFIAELNEAAVYCDEGIDDHTSKWWSPPKAIICAEAALELAVKHKLTVSLKPGRQPNSIKKSVAVDGNKTVEMMSQSWNTRVGVPVAGNPLMDVNNVLLLEDCCTDVLQRTLNKGWKMMAVCPQPDGRRPDYILGRSSSDIRGRERALRSYEVHDNGDV